MSPMHTSSGLISVNNPVAIYRQRGFKAGRFERGIDAGRATAKNAGEKELAAFNEGVRLGRRERERAS